ncbi:glycosyltransferase family 2 protein [Candidatus Laterigemmans baculatus]|uniref:glycosyltransferase family 2 protein n=1 Tax=Candidatus Laterigemmans baculatus TaxID=2770505 RepID=UPI0013DA0259|nr:glycosyltransferase [Candidatus Laterigemmans baculatus]
MCRLSIIVPYNRDEAAFETTLVSVLENRPEHSEVVVAHDGSYSDPFDLGDEVRFVVADSGELVALVQAAVRAAFGRVVHILHGGARATAGWADEAVELFEQADLGAVAPVIQDLCSGGRIVAAGWRDDSRGLRRAIAAGAAEPSRRDVAGIEGVYLAASFWRRSALESLAELPSGSAPSVVDYLWASALRTAGWRCRVATESRVLASPTLLAPAEGARRAGAAMQAVRSGLKREGAATVATAAAVAILCRPLSLSAWSEALGRLSGASGGASLARSIRRYAEDASPDASQPMVLSLPERQTTYRRAA